jgi:hypothetical protein
MYNNRNDTQGKLAAPFDDGDIEWRLQHVYKDKGEGIAVPYVTNRAIQARLDLVFGINGWKNEFIPWHSDGKKASQLCGISVWIYERGEWVTKYDGADNSDIEPIKGGLSDAMKRSAVQWGIGRYLYSMPTVYVKCDQRGSSAVIAKSEYKKLNKAHSDHVKKLFGIPDAPAETDAPPGKPDKQEAPPAPAKQPPQGKQRRDQAPDARKTANTAKPAPAPAVPPKLPAAIPGAYTIVKTAPVASVKRGQDTNLLLADSDGKQTQVYAQGADPRLAPGAVLTDAVINEKMSEGVIYRILESCTFATKNNAA